MTVGYIFPPHPDKELILSVVRDANRSKTEGSFAIADAVNAIDVEHGDKGELVREIANIMGVEAATAQQYAVYGKLYPHANRDARLAFNTYRRAAELFDKRASLQLISWAIENIDAFDTQVFGNKLELIKEALPCADEEIKEILETPYIAPPPKVKPITESFTVVESLTDAADVEQAIANLTAKVVEKWLELLSDGKCIKDVRMRLNADYWLEEEEVNVN